MANFRNDNSNTLLSGTSGDDSIRNGGSWYENGVDTWHDGGSNVTINAAEGNDSVDNYFGSKVTINTGASNDYVWNGGSSVTINTGEGNDLVYNDGSSVTINTGAGNDYVANWSDKVTISGGKSNDTIYNNWNFDKNAPSEYYYGKYVLFKYSAGDGNDVIYGFNDNDKSVAALIPPKKAAIMLLSRSELEKFR